MTVLEALGEPADCVVCVDFETHYSSAYGLKKYTTEQYVRDEQFQVIGVGVKIGDRPAVWMSEIDFRAWAINVDWSRIAVLAHNAAFDAFILAQHFDIVPGFILDTLSIARAIHGTEVGGSLAKLSEHYQIGVKGHEVLNALGKRLADFTPEEWFAYGAYCRNDCELTYRLLWKLLGEGFPEQELFVIDLTLRMFVDPVFELDSALLIDYLEYEKQRKLDLLERINADRDALMSNQKFSALLLEMGVDPPTKISAKTGKEAFAFAKTDPGMKALLEHENTDVRVLAEARVGVKSTINESRTERFLKMGQNGRPVPVFLAYHKAHTGRWAGGDKVNFQNLERVPKKKNTRKGVLRKALLAPEGYAIVASDSAQIEARVLAWLAGHETLVEAFAQGRDVYSEFASVAYGRHVDRKKNPEDEIPGFVGKTCILGLGYGLGWAKLSQTMLAGAMGGPPVQFKAADALTMKVDVQRFANDTRLMKRMASIPTRLEPADMMVHSAVAKALVDRYRDTNATIVELWKEMDNVLVAMLRDQEYSFGPNGCLKTSGESIVLPSGRTLKYPGLEGEDDGFSFHSGRNGKDRSKVYGGLLVENCTQALARDIIAEQMLWVSIDRKIVTTTHDEIVAMAAVDEAPAALAEMLAIMKRPPTWAAGIPLSAEGGFARSYGDAK